MSEMNQFEYTLDDDEEKKYGVSNKFPTKAKIIITILIIIIILLIGGLIGFIIYALPKIRNYNKNKEDKENKENGYPNFIIKYSNLSYTEDKIKNSFKIGGANFLENIGEINDGKDYDKTDRNIYDLYIPNKDIKKDGINHIILFLHSGGWILGSKEEMSYLCLMTSSYGHITANIGYTLLSQEYKKYKVNIFRILDEITACIESIKITLGKEGFNTDKLEIAICGASAGGHLSLLYAYLMKNSPIPIKYIINYSGPVTLEPEYFIKVKNQNEPLESIEISDIENAKKADKIERLFPTDKRILYFMNFLTGNKTSEEDLIKILENDRINKNNDIYKEMFNFVENGFPVKYVNKESPPVLCVFGGKDEAIGIGHYSYLKSKYIESNNNKIDIIYSKNSFHNIFLIDGKPNIDLMNKIAIKIKEYSKLYFTS